MVKALKRELPSVLAIYHIMHKRADTIGCVWLAYCINSFYSYFGGRSRICTLNCKLSTILARLCDCSMSESSALPCVLLFHHRPYFRTDGLNFTPRHFSSFRAAKRKEVFCQKHGMVGHRGLEPRTVRL